MLTCHYKSILFKLLSLLSICSCMISKQGFMKMEHFCEALLSYVTTINLYLEVIDFKHFNTGTLDDVISISDFDNCSL